MKTDPDVLAPQLLEAVLAKLGFSDRPPPTLEGLRQVYAAWCRRVPFDNLRKLIHIVAGDPAPLPGDTPQDFFEGWLAHGAGGTCWSGNGALHALLLSLGFDSTRGLGTMLLAPDIPPNHGTVIVGLEGKRYVVDASILHGEPLELDAHRRTGHAARPWGVNCERQNGHWHIRWRPVNIPEGLIARIDRLATTRDTFRELHEATRPWSPFNYELYARVNRDDKVIGIAMANVVELLADNRFSSRPLASEERMGFLVDELGVSEELAARVPPDRHRPPPPGSRTAAEQT